MLRNLLVSIFFFIGPALLMFIARNMVLLLLLWLKARQAREMEQKVIDITPVRKQRAPRWFYILVLLVSLTSAISVFMMLQNGDVPPQEYVPAYTDEAGNIVPGQWRPKAPNSE